jgi:hypothetical protein
MSASTSKTCLNCNVENETTFQYCPNCGQKNTNGKITFSELWSEFKDAAFNIDSRTGRTLKNLFIPGKLTLEYFSGKHRQYVHPLRLLLVLSILVIIAMSFQKFESATNHSWNVKERIQKNYERQRLFGILENIVVSTNAIFPEQQTEIITDTILTTFEDSLRSLLFESSNKFENRNGDRYGDSIDLNQYVRFFSEHKENISKHDFLNMSEDELVGVYKKEAGVLERTYFKQKVKFINDESLLSATIIGHTTWAFLLMMPCLALILYLLYIRHSYFYIEHLIFTFHLQSFLFFVLAILIVGLNVFPWWIPLMLMTIIWVYLYISMRTVYKQSYGKTFLKFLLLNVSYGILFFLFLLGNVFISLFLL